jgi:hypothetical protein
VCPNQPHCQPGRPLSPALPSDSNRPPPSGVLPSIPTPHSRAFTRSTWGTNTHTFRGAGGGSPWTAGVGWHAIQASSCLSRFCRAFRKVYLHCLQQAYATGKLQFHGDLEPLVEPQNFAWYLAPLRELEWVVCAKPPFGGPERVLDYLGRYTHRVASSNNRAARYERRTSHFCLQGL